jgi:hypothetical protein
MAISGLVVTLIEDASIADQAIRRLSADSRLSLGDRAGWRVPLVAETPSAASDAQLWAELLATPGIKSVDVTFVSIDPAGVDEVEPDPVGGHP